jgi:tRNA(adenine34) deaminase
MQAALAEAQAAIRGEVPIGAVVVPRGTHHRRGHNRVEAAQDPTAHAEIIATGAAAQTLQHMASGRRHPLRHARAVRTCARARSSGLYRTALSMARAIPRREPGGSPRHGASRPRLNHRAEVVPGVLAEDASLLLEQFSPSQAARHEPPET